MSRIDAVLKSVLGTTDDHGEDEAASYLKVFYQQLILGSQVAARHPTRDSEAGYYAYETQRTRAEAQARRLENLLTALSGQAAQLALGASGAGPVSREELQAMRDDPDLPSTKLNDALEDLLERTDADLDEAKGARSHKHMAVVQGDLAAERGKRSQKYASRHMRPQESFDTQPDNSTTPFVPIIKLKHNASVPLPDYSSVSVGAPGYKHPYDDEIRSLEYVPEQLRRREPVMPGSLADVPLSWVSTPSQFEAMLNDLEQPGVTELAIDLEHHSLHSYLGFTCLIQLSTRFHDYIVDALALRSAIPELNRVCSDPRVVKVLHGCDKDVIWLQRDFGVYLVNVFDTGQAARVLQFPSFGLLHLLQSYCGVIPDKALQKADWRIRPLSSAMKKYAREDTHYLLFVYDKLVNELLDRSTSEDGNLLRNVLERSAEVTLNTYQKPVVTPESHMRLMDVVGLGTASAQQQQVFADLYAWRDSVARDIDESPVAVLHHRPMAKLARSMPVNTQQLVEALNPLPDHVRTRAQKVLQVIVAAKKRTAPGAAANPLSARRPTASSPHAFISSRPATPDHRLSGMLSPTPSPTPSAEQLCKEAGWMPPPDPRQPGRTSLSACTTPEEDAEGRAIRARITKALRDTLRAAQEAGAIDDVDEGSDVDIPQPPALPPPVTSSAAGDVTMTDASGGGAASPNRLATPRSLAEIYQISNRNRKRNKNKKKLKDTASGRTHAQSAPPPPPSKHRTAAGAGAGAGVGAAKDESAEDFMKRIGWTNEDLDTGAAGADAGAGVGAGAGAGGSGSASRDAEAPSFNYGRAVSARAGMGATDASAGGKGAAGSGSNKSGRQGRGRAGRGSKSAKGRSGGGGGGGGGAGNRNNPYAAAYGGGGGSSGNSSGAASASRGKSGTTRRRGGAYKARMRHAGQRTSASGRTR